MDIPITPHNVLSGWAQSQYAKPEDIELRQGDVWGQLAHPAGWLYIIQYFDGTDNIRPSIIILKFGQTRYYTPSVEYFKHDILLGPLVNITDHIHRVNEMFTNLKIDYINERQKLLQKIMDLTTNPTTNSLGEDG